MSVTMSHALDSVTLKDHHGRDIELRTLWSERPAVLLFVRQFGCIFCRQQIAEAEAHREWLDAAGARLVAIGNGSVQQANEFAAETNTRATVPTDPDKVSYCTVGMKRTVRSSMNTKTLFHGLAAWRDGFRQTKLAGDPLQQGGVLVLGRGGNELYRYVSEHAGDHPDFRDVLAALVESSTAVSRHAAE
jgi:peroxiredoxin